MSTFGTGGKALPIIVSGDPRLRLRSSEISEIGDIQLAQAGDLIATLRDFRDRSGFGRAISAVQVGWMDRVVAMNLGAGPFLLVNPEITWRSEETFVVWDDCLSVPDALVRVRRHCSLSLTYRDHRFRLREWKRLPPDLSELVQHEINHLDGVLMTDLAEGNDAIQPMSRWAELVGAGRPASRLSLARIVEADALIDPVFSHTPQYECEPLSKALGASVVLKVETANPIRSFKGRGASYFVARSIRESSLPGKSLACASAGNFGQALAYACRADGLSLFVFAAKNANPFKVDRMRALGAEVRLEGADFDAAKDIGRVWAKERDIPFIEDGREAWISEGAGTIGRELLARDDAFDAVLVPLGNGALLNGVARWLKAASPSMEVIGVCAEGAPAMERSWRNGPMGPMVETKSVDTIADGVGVRVPIPEAVRDMHEAPIDDVMLVGDDWIRRAVTLVHEHVGLVLEPAGALGIAAMLTDPARFAGRRVATILCGGNPAATA